MVESIMNKIAEKISAQDIIKANLQAEAAETERIKQETERMRQEAEQYKAQMEEMKQVSEEYRNVIQEMRNDAQDYKKQLQEMKEDTREYKDKLQENETKIHDVGVQVYRNVQAIIEKGEAKNREEFKELCNKLEYIQVTAETKNSAVMPLVIVTMIIALADLVFNLLRFLGII